MEVIPSLNGKYFWMNIDEFDVIYGNNSKTFSELGFELILEIVGTDGTIFILLKVM
jgi:hypothetical protein